MAKARDFKFCTLVYHMSISLGMANCPSNGRGHGHV